MSSCHVTTTSEMSAIDSALLTYNLNESVSVLSFASVTVTVTVDVPVLDGVPLIRPLDRLIVIAKGAPDIVNTYGVLPPDADAVLAGIALFTSTSTSRMSSSSTSGQTTVTVILKDSPSAFP